MAKASVGDGFLPWRLKAPDHSRQATPDPSRFPSKLGVNRVKPDAYVGAVISAR